MINTIQKATQTRLIIKLENTNKTVTEMTLNTMLEGIKEYLYHDDFVNDITNYHIPIEKVTVITAFKELMIKDIL